jgi:hypothetical protein
MESTFVYRNRGGVKRTSIVDSENPYVLRVKTEQNMDRIIEQAKALGENHKDGSVNKHLATVPISVYEQSVHEQWDEADWKKWLNDPDNACFRVWKGRV